MIVRVDDVGLRSVPLETTSVENLAVIAAREIGDDVPAHIVIVAIRFPVHADVEDEGVVTGSASEHVHGRAALDRVVTAAAVDVILAPSAFEVIVAGATHDVIVPRVANDVVVTVRANE